MIRAGSFACAILAEIALQPHAGSIIRCPLRGPGRANQLVGDVGVYAAIAHIFHMQIAVSVERMKQGIGSPVELERQHAEFLAKAEVERGRSLDPAAIDPQLGIAVKYE